MRDSILTKKFTIYIDESGETGITKIRNGNSRGASPYFVVGAVVSMPTAEVLAKNCLDGFREEIGKTSWKHATDLSHTEKVLLARELGRLPVRFFAVVSNKSTLEDYKEEIQNDPQKYYNKCVKYLLETVCGYLARHVSSDDEIGIVLEQRNHDYDKLIRYILRVKDRPLYTQSRSLSVLNPFSITTAAKGTHEMLDIADFVAHAVFQCANRSRANFGIPEPRYFKEMSSRFAGDAVHCPLGVGLKCIHSLEQLQLDLDIEQLWRRTIVSAPSLIR